MNDRNEKKSFMIIIYKLGHGKEAICSTNCMKGKLYFIKVLNFSFFKVNLLQSWFKNSVLRKLETFRIFSSKPLHKLHP